MNKLSANLIAAVFAVACIDARAADPAKPSCVQTAQAETTGESGPRQTVQAPAADGSAAVSSVGNLAGGAGGGAAAASYARAVTPATGVPKRISMNVTVPKQTQGATFGEKVNAGLHAAGSALSQGASAAPGEVSGCVVDAAAATPAATAEKKAEPAPTAVSDDK